jgi:3-phosphoshikimate 1-carboxyvinyltransferase
VRWTWDERPFHAARADFLSGTLKGSSVQSIALRAPVAGRRAHVVVPGDKSISHRALLLAAMARGRTRIIGANRGLDVLATVRALRALGIRVSSTAAGFVVTGGAMRDPRHVIDCANSGTTMRLLAGALAGRVDAQLDGDASLRRRPMSRVTEPLALMGARISTRRGYPPLRIYNTSQCLRPIHYRMRVASAQVASAIIIAALGASGPSTIIEKAVTRDHTQRLLAAMGAKLRCTGRTLRVQPCRLLAVPRLKVPGDISAALYLLCAAATLPRTRLVLRNVGVNPTRTAALEVLRTMGAAITTSTRREWCHEPVADISISGGWPLHNVAVRAGLVPILIDEIPALCAVAAAARGTFCVRNAAELRVKESDRVETTVRLLRAFGADARALDDGIVVRGGKPLHAPRVVTTFGDHRIGLAAAILAAATQSAITIRDSACVATSFPGFASVWRKVF